MSESFMTELALLVFILVSTALGRVMARIERARQGRLSPELAEFTDSVGGHHATTDPAQSRESHGGEVRAGQRVSGEASARAGNVPLTAPPIPSVCRGRTREFATVTDLRRAFKLMVLLAPPKALTGSVLRNINREEPHR